MKQRSFTERLRGAMLPGVRYIPGHHGFRGFEGLWLKDWTPAMKAATSKLVWDGTYPV
jgi:hypothetical protein